MLIEIADKQYWRQLVEKAITDIYKEQDRRNKKFETEWRKSKWWRPWSYPETSLPIGNWLEYPSWYGSFALSKLQSIHDGLLNQDSKTILLTDEEMEMINKWAHMED